MRGKKPDITLVDGSCIAGGAVRQWFTGREGISDIDIFFQNESALKSFIAQSLPSNTAPVHQTVNADTYLKGEQVIQCIKLKYFVDIQELFDSFDFTCCQFAFCDGKIYSTVEAVVSTLRGHLGIHKIQKGFELDSLRRAFKYQKKGFKPCLGTMRSLAESFRDIQPEDLAKQTEISPAGGKRLIRYD